MNEKVLAAVAIAPKTTEIRAFDFPDIAPDAGLLRVEAAGVCGSDWPAYVNGKKMPNILGHENIGYIEKIGDVARRAWGIKEGDRVALEEYLPCGHCHRCRTGEFRLCDETDPWMGGIRYGSSPITIAPSLWGGYSQYQYLHPRSVFHKVPTNVNASELALALPIGNGVEWVIFEGNVKVGKTIVIQGPGQQGLACVLAAKEAGASNIIVSGLAHDENRLQLALKLGADHVVNVEKEDLTEKVREVTGGELADVVLDVSSGGTATVKLAMELAKKRGTVLLAGMKHQNLDDFSSDQMIRKYLTVKGIRGHSYEAVELAIAMIASGKYPISEFCTHEYGLIEVDKALRTVGREMEPGAIHVTVNPWK